MSRKIRIAIFILAAILSTPLAFAATLVTANAALAAAHLLGRDQPPGGAGLYGWLSTALWGFIIGATTVYLLNRKSKG